MAITAKVDGKQLVLVMDLQAPTLSKSGKTKIVATTGGFVQTTAKVDGQPVSVSVNAFIK